MADNKQTLDAAMALIEEQGRKIAELEAKVSPTPKAKAAPESVPTSVVTVGKKKFKFTVVKYIDATGNTVLAKDMLSNLAELERLVTIKSGILKAV